MSAMGPARRWVTPIAALCAVLGFAVAFPDLALLCIVAVLIVYLIEPLVAGLTALSVRGRHLPRWGAVIVVYTCSLGLTIGFGAIFGPVVANEATAVANEVPNFVRDAQTRYAPRIDTAVRSFRSLLASEVPVEAPMGAARDRVEAARGSAHIQALLAAALDADELGALRGGHIVVEAEAPAHTSASVLARLRPGPGGTLDVLPGDGSLRVQRDGEGVWIIEADRGAPSSGSGEGDVTRALTASIDSAMESSGRRVAEVLHVGQKLVLGLLSAVVSIFVTFMVAAFISIDAPRVVGFVTSLFPTDTRPAVTRLLGRLDDGLSGVIRGQLAICVINAFLTGLGLFLFNVKFALLLALIAGVCSLIPIFGTIISTIPCVILALPQGIGTAVLVVVWIIVIHFIEANILQPKIMGTTARIHPAIVILALVAGEHAIGIIGALVAVPVVSVAQSLLFFARDEYSGGTDADEGASEEGE